MSKTLAKEFGSLNVVVAAGNGTLGPSAEGWEQIDPVAPVLNRIFINHKYFDLAGMSMDDKTLFFDGAAVQDVGLPSVAPATAGQVTGILDIMSTKPISNDQALSLHLYGNIPSLDSTAALTFDQTIYFRMRRFNIDIDNLASGYSILLSDDQLGSLSPTASDRVYCTRIVVVGATDGAYLVYPGRYIIRANAKEEPEYEYLMRLKRSYELQQEPDRD